MIEFNNVRKMYKKNVVLKNIDLKIKSHEFFVLVGPSGSGKTTLLKMINRLVDPSEGVVLIDDQNVAQVPSLRDFRKSIGYVVQSSALFPNLTVYENILLTLKNAKKNIVNPKKIIAEFLEKVDLNPTEFMDKYPNELSGGEEQRVGIIRALVFEPNIMLMDEPFSALDPISRKQLQELLINLQNQLKTTIVFVTHDMQEALLLADRIAVLHDGEIKQIGQPNEILQKPANDFVKKMFHPAIKQAISFTVGQLLDAGFGQRQDKVPPVEAQNSLTKMTSLAHIASLMKQSENQSVLVGDMLVRPVDLVNFLASVDED